MKSISNKPKSTFLKPFAYRKIYYEYSIIAKIYAVGMINKSYPISNVEVEILRNSYNNFTSSDSAASELLSFSPSCVHLRL